MTNMPVLRVTLRIRGEVQGVTYRESARREALRLGLRGWIRNRHDGTVEAVAEGPEDALERFETWCRRGPALARVTEVETERAAPQGGFATFSVEPTS